MTTEAVDKVDLLVMVDNSNSMRENQTNLMSQFSSMLDSLTHPPCVSPTNPSPHVCTSDPADSPQSVPVTDMHIGVVSSDLGTPGSSVPGCANSDLGDDGLLNPIRNGQALLRHEPWLTAPPTFGRPTDCNDPNQFPSFLSFYSATTDPATLTHDFQCNAGLYVNGCGLESQLDAIYRALIIHDATDRAGNISPNAGFLRENALLFILVLTDEEDGSVRDCRFANGMPCEGQGAIDVYNPASTYWSAMELNLRFYMYAPCGQMDPNWPLERYVDPANPNTGLLSLKPSHPERILFAAIAGVPLNIATTGTGTQARINWDSLLGTPGAAGPEDFCARDSSLLGQLSSAEGPISMMQANADPNCTQRVVPACRREGSSPTTGCTTTDQYFAWPSRRIVEIARRFDQSPLCNGAPCNNGLVTSVCSSNYAIAMRQIVQRMQSRLTGECLARTLPTVPDASGNVTVDCLARLLLPAGEDMCDPSRGLRDPMTNGTTRTPMYVTDSSGQRRVCDVDQVATNPATHQPAGSVGWYYDTSVDPMNPSCMQRITFTMAARPEAGSVARLQCPGSSPGDAGLCR